MTAKEGNNQVNDTGGASGVNPQSVPHTREYFRAVNYGSWVSYVLSQGAYYDANGYLYYRGRLLTQADTEYITQGYFDDHIADEDELRNAWLVLLDIAGVGEGNE
jgi:hypothetical protein